MDQPAKYNIAAAHLRRMETLRKDGDSTDSEFKITIKSEEQESDTRTVEPTYKKCGDYYIPDIALPDTPEYRSGRYGRMRQKLLREHHPGACSHMLLPETPWEHLT